MAVDECLLLHPLLDELHKALASQAANEDAADEVDDRPPTILRRVSLRAGVNTGHRLLAFESQGDRAPAFAVEDLAVRCVLRRRDGSIQPLIGEPWIEEQVAGRGFRVSAGSFFQVNTVGAEAMVTLADEMLSLQGHETLLDGYCGVGLFALSLAGRAAQVIGIEESEAACEDFAWNGADLDNVVLYEGPVAEVLAALNEAGNGGSEPAFVTRIDAAIIDPPRSGAGPAVVRELRRLPVRRLLYVSCDPATLARDARHLLEAGYRLVQVQPIDLFPQTYHVESLALFQL
jgi:23S rRNA (uracil1939-C5)-methyltransferase